MHTTGTHINYYFLCRRKLWFFSKGIQCEQESELVHKGKLIHENSYKNKRKEYAFGDIKVDWIDLKNKVIHEVKKSDAVDKPHLWQLKYYIYYLEKIGAGKFTGEINYPKLNKKIAVTLEDDDYKKIEEYAEKIENIKTKNKPPKERPHKKLCKSCSYFELCSA
jgi:CRISPR-associated exonuclease Cas4